MVRRNGMVEPCAAVRQNRGLTPVLRLLVNFWYAHPVGHAIEALRYCLGYEKRVRYGDALREYFTRLLAAYAGDRSKVFSFDGIDSQYI